MPKLIKELEPLQEGMTIEEIREQLTHSGVFNGSFVAVRATEAILTGDSEKLLRKGKNIDTICQYPAEQVIEVYNAAVAEANTQKGVIKNVGIFAFKVFTIVMAKFNVKLPFDIKK